MLQYQLNKGVVSTYIVANFTPKELGINATYGCQIDGNTIALLDHWTGNPKLVLISFK